MTSQEMKSLPWDLWKRQIRAVASLELHKSFLQRRGWWLLALAPVLLTGAHSLFAMSGKWPCSLGVDTRAYAGIFQVFILRLGIFFGCAGIFTTMFRGEVSEKTLHYYFLTPMPRWILAAGKYIAGEIIALTFFVGSAALSYILITLHFGAAHWQRLLRGPGLHELFWYIIVASLACLGYGAIFLALGLWFKNPMIPAAIVFVWEGINPFLPAVMKKASVIFYLQGLCPVEVINGGPLSQIEVLADPTPAYLAIPGLVILTSIVLAVACLSVRKMEVNYGE